MTCKFCDRVWEESDLWERAASNESQLQSQESDANWDLIQRASEIQRTNPARALQLYLEAAETGSVWSMEMVGWHYATGSGVAADRSNAREYYYRAICGGSWMATLGYAQLLAEDGYHDDCEKVLEDGVSLDFVPAYFRLAWHRYQRSRTRDTCKQIRPMLEHAAGRGHPAAKVFLAKWMSLGKFGLGEIPRGLRLVLQGAVRFARRCEEVGEQNANLPVPAVHR